MICRNAPTRWVCTRLLLHLDEVKDADWVPWLLGIEEVERKRRSLEQIGRTWRSF